MPEQIQSIVRNLQDFGPKRLGILAAAAVLVLALVGGTAALLNRPAYEVLYVGLERADVNSIGLALGEAGIGFDVGSDGSTVSVQSGMTAQARMLLAEKGLPTSANAGYELFDNVGSLGLTSFMQEVTRVRALEGEIARTLQSINGIKAARVHLVMGERASFRRDAEQPSASVVIRTVGIDAETKAGAIRHLVAAAVPGLNAEKVTVLDASGTLLAAGDDPSNTSAARSLGVEQTVEREIEDNIRRALMPYLGPENFRASVKAEVNTDSRQTEEITFDPDSRVERSVQTVKSAENSSQNSAAAPTTVEENLPDAGAKPGDGPKSSENNERKEEITNYEMNSKKVATTSNGYQMTKMSVAVVVNRARLQAILGKDAKPADLDARIAEIKALVASATGFNETRGDAITVSSVEFVDGLDGVEVPEPGLMDKLSAQAGTMINAGAFVVVALLVLFLGLRPLTNALRGPAAPEANAAVADAMAALTAGNDSPFALPMPDEMGGPLGLEGGALPLPGFNGTFPAPSFPGLGMDGGNPLDDLRQKIKPAPQDRLVRMVDLNEERTAQILRKWAHEALEEAA